MTHQPPQHRNPMPATTESICVTEPLEGRRLLAANLVNAGDPDPSFGTAGRATFDFGGQDETVSAITSPAEGQLLLLERHFLSGAPVPAGNFLRLTANGSPDTTFAPDGVVPVAGAETL